MLDLLLGRERDWKVENCFLNLNKLLQPKRTQHKATQHTWHQLRRAIQDSGYEWDPHAALLLLQQVYAPSTAFTYAKRIVQQFPDEFSNDTYKKATMAALRATSNILPTTHAALPATPDEVRKLIGQVQTNEQRAIWQMWVTASRFADTKTWQTELIQTPRHNFIKISSLWNKTSSDGALRHFKWTETPSINEALRWKWHDCEGEPLLAYVKSPVPHLSLHSFRHGAIALLEEKFPTEQISQLTGHRSTATKNPGAEAYLLQNPSCFQARTVLTMTKYLRDSVAT